ncbi:TlpA family protein disulfide reductase [Zhouia amylolytica]|uniref:Thioredoxin domain-containing protein n=1 Tax=Zhouia amylolytica AD3 TaxID=1286632 RepID=W2UJL4_9FLAO|nr:TlpA disulfide reductase family protein [Zhouia amylolytica]ETN94335.1 hypothetical protein P278_22770 [Zhouia amylolytica AD3]
MKKKLSIIPLFLLLLISCNTQESGIGNNEITINGRVNNYNGENAELYLIHSQPGTKKYRESINIDSVGNFKIKLKSSIPLDAFILEKKSFANINFIYHPNDSIYLEFSPQKNNLDLLKTVRFKGGRHQTNNLLIDFQILREENNLGYGAIQPISYEKNAIDFKTEMDSLKLEQQELIKRFKNKNSLNTEEKEWITSFGYETYYYFLDDYGFGRENLPDGYFDYNNDVPNITISNIVSWRNLSERINSYSMNRITPEIQKKFSPIMDDIIDGKINSDSLIIEYFEKNIPNDLLKQLLLSHYYTAQFKENFIEGYRKNLTTLNSLVKLPIIKENLDNYYRETLDFINKPNLYSNEVLAKMKNTPIEETFSKILSINKGKVIYMDIWATWCSPCIKAMPHSKKLMEKFNGEDVSFVYVCIESKEDLWKRLVSDFNLGGGQHYLIDKDQSKFFRSALDVQGIPQYFIIDKNGNIVERGKDIHPSNRITEEKIKEKLK